MKRISRLYPIFLAAFLMLSGIPSCTKENPQSGESPQQGGGTGTDPDADQSGRPGEKFAFSGGAGTAADPYQIALVRDLDSLRLWVESERVGPDTCFVQTADIDLTGISFGPVGSAEQPFVGSYDGGCLEIRGLSVSATADNAGLFGYAGAGAVIKDVRLKSASVSTSGKYAGGIVGYLDGGSVSGCRVDEECSITAAGRGAAGIAGFVKAGSIRECAFNGFVSAVDCVGGIAGYVNPSVDGEEALLLNCVVEPVYKDGRLYGASLQSSAKSNAYMGGIAGSVALSGGKGLARVANCFSYPLVLASSQTAGTIVNRIGGVIGYVSPVAKTAGIELCNCLSPVTYSNVVVGGERISAFKQSSYTQAASIAGQVGSDGAVFRRLYSTNTWAKSYSVNSGKTLTEENIVKSLGNTNLRGNGDVVVGSTTFTESQGGIKAALNAGVSEWNADHADAQALAWEYDPCLGYPKPAGVAAGGVPTKKVSLIGDSISTYQGFMFSDGTSQFNKFYPYTSATEQQQTQFAPMVVNEQLTWWWRLIYDKMRNARLEVSNAFSGSTVSYYTGTITNAYGTSKDGAVQTGVSCLQKRNQDYGLGHPDILIYYGGRNDFGAYGKNTSVLLGSYDETSLQAAYDAPSVLYANYSQGTVAILRDFHMKNPSAKILMLVHDQVNDGYEDAANAIAAFLSGKGFNLRLVNFHVHGTTNQTNTDIGIVKESGTHPNATGTSNMVEHIWGKVGNWLQE